MNYTDAQMGSTTYFITGWMNAYYEAVSTDIHRLPPPPVSPRLGAKRYVMNEELVTVRIFRGWIFLHSSKIPP